MERLDKLVGGNAGLFEQPRQRADFQFAVIGHDTARRPAPHDNVAAVLTSDDKTKEFQCANRVRA